jgi:hypothetical protein
LFNLGLLLIFMMGLGPDRGIDEATKQDNKADRQNNSGHLDVVFFTHSGFFSLSEVGR